MKRSINRPARIAMAAAVLAATGALTVTFVTSGGNGAADAATSLDQYVPIQQVQPGPRPPKAGPDAATGRFTVNCGTNGNGKFSPDNPVAQPGIKNGAEHLHDFVGNKDITADSSNAELDASGTTCRNGDKSSYFWPVVRIDRSVRSADQVKQALAHTQPMVVCPSVRDRIPAGVAWRGRRILAELDRLTAEANRRMTASHGRIDTRLNKQILDGLRERRAALIKRLGRDLISLVDCDVSYDAMHASMHSAAPVPAPSASALPEPQGRNLELPGNTGGIVRPARVLIEYRGNPVSKVVPMPKFLRALTGDAKPTSRGPANARGSWSCSGFGDRLSEKYTICPTGSRVQRVHDFPGCWDGVNIDSDNHRKHVAFADKVTGACPQGFKAIPQLRITISYDIPRDVQRKGQYALDSFPEENHNPFSDHDDFINVNSARTMQRIATCINRGRNCS
ncbi:DUF1996 domain-containing protein [Actinoplanes sp. NPDC026670]|uniref:DUF1996 domain-containing protein n=1 Tax=Actinoplanes sp. NPDC026670 TaxID=3154700 RepID=UPI0033E2C160